MIIKSLAYHINFENDSFRELSKFLRSKKFSQHFILCDENTIKHCLPPLITQCKELRDAEIIEVESGEGNKSIEISSLIWQTLIEFEADKNSLLINLGGGVISDLGGFTASLYKRGISFVNIPTTVLAMADASVGGKTGIDFLNLKNVIGTFTQPSAVFINTTFLNTLEERHRYNGLVEIYKIALVADKKFWKLLKEEIPDEEKIKRSVQLKNKIVLKDPFDKGLRKILNFGHTVGHAIESLLLDSVKPLLHGEAILIGMIIESNLALQKKLLTKKEYQEIFITLNEQFALPAIKLPDTVALIQLIKNDKKRSKDSLNFSLVQSIGGCKINVQVTTDQLQKAIDTYNSLKHGES